MLTMRPAWSFSDRYEEYQWQIHVPEATKRLLDRCLQTGIYLGVITNGAHDHQMDKVRTMQLARWIPETHILISEDCGAAKPDARIFRQAEEIAEVSGQGVLLCGGLLEK